MHLPLQAGEAPGGGGGGGGGGSAEGSGESLTGDLIEEEVVEELPGLGPTLLPHEVEEAEDLLEAYFMQVTPVVQGCCFASCPACHVLLSQTPHSGTSGLQGCSFASCPACHVLLAMNTALRGRHSLRAARVFVYLPTPVDLRARYWGAYMRVSYWAGWNLL